MVDSKIPQIYKEKHIQSQVTLVFLHLKVFDLFEGMFLVLIKQQNKRLNLPREKFRVRVK